MQYDTVMALEAKALSFLRKPFSDDEMDPKGLCNAVIIARPGAEFLKRWLATYDEFSEWYWTQHSVVRCSIFDSSVMSCEARSLS